MKFTHQFQRVALVILALLPFASHAQNGYTQYRLPGLQQSQALNPAFSPDAKVHLGLPGLTGFDVRVAHDGFAFADVITIRPDDSLAFDIDNMISKLGKSNLLSFDSRFELLSFGIGGKKGFFSFAITERVHARFGYPRDLPILAWEGNGQQLLGDRASFDDLMFNFQAFREFAFGYTYRFSDRLAGGMRFKHMQGHFNVHTRESLFGLHTDAITYDLTIDGGGTVNTSGINELVNDSIDMNRFIFDNTNSGFGFDLGIDYQHTKRLALSASVLDLGSIRWRHDTRTYSAEPFSFTFQGVDINQALVDSLDVFEEMLDSLEQFVVTKEDVGAYRTPLNPKVFLSAQYALTQRLTVGGMLHTEFLRNRMLTTLAVSLDATLGRWLAATVNYAYSSRSFANVGLGLTLRGGPFQFYVVADNVVAAFAPHRVRQVQAAAGLNFTFGRRSEKPARTI
jgi:hypothetical protein